MGIRCTLLARSSADRSERRLRLDKAWDALEVLLTGGRGVAGQIGDAVTGRGGKKCAPHGAFGPARRLDADRVAQIAEALAAIDETTLRSRYDRLAALEVHGGYGAGRGAGDPASAGGHLFVAASGSGASHVVAWLVPAEHGTFALRGLALGSGRLVPGQIRVDGSGVSVLVEDRRTGSYPRGYEERDFRRFSRRDEPRWGERCF